MAKKDFSSINTNPVYSTIAEATAEQEVQEVQQKRKPRKTYTAQEAQEYLQDMNTIGRKGLKLPRINVAFAPDVYDYIVTMSRASGISLTEFVNKVIREHYDDHKDIYDKAVEFRNSL